VRFAGGAFATTATIASNAAGISHLNFFPDRDTAFRWCPTLIGYDQRVYPAFAVAVARHFVTRNQEALTTGQGIVRISEEDEIPVETDADMLVAYLGPAGHFPVVSAADVLDGGFLPEIFKNKAVLIGPTDPTLAGALPTPTTPRMSALELHASVLDNILANRFYRRGPFLPLAELAWFLVAAVVAAFVLPRLKAAAGAVTAIGLLVAFLGAAVICSCRGDLAAPFYPMLVVVLSTSRRPRSRSAPPRGAGGLPRSGADDAGHLVPGEGDAGPGDADVQTAVHPDMKAIYYSRPRLRTRGSARGLRGVETRARHRSFQDVEGAWLRAMPAWPRGC
jgi:hypothetical protein